MSVEYKNPKEHIGPSSKIKPTLYLSKNNTRIKVGCITLEKHLYMN